MADCPTETVSLSIPSILEYKPPASINTSNSNFTEINQEANNRLNDEPLPHHTARPRNGGLPLHVCGIGRPSNLTV